MEIDKVSSISSLKKSGPMQPLPVVDQLSLSGEGQKISEFVEMLKEMPDLRDEKLSAIHERPSLDHLARLIAAEIH